MAQQLSVPAAFKKDPCLVPSTLLGGFVQMHVQTHMYVSFKMQSQKSVRLYKHSCTTRCVILVTYQEIYSHVTVYVNVYWTKLDLLRSSYEFQSSIGQETSMPLWRS